MEVIYTLYDDKEWVNRGFLMGPLCPIYGCGVILLVKLLTPLSNNIILLFLGAVFLTSFLEYVTGFLLEKVFNNIWWDYSYRKFNLKGRICLEFSIYWGIFGTVVVKYIHPQVVNLININNLNKYLIYTLFLYFWTDCILTLISLFELKRSFSSLQDIKNKYVETIKNINTSKITNKLNEIKLIKKEIKIKNEIIYKQITNAQIRILKAFPNIKSKKYDIIEDFKKKLKRTKE